MLMRNGSFSSFLMSIYFAFDDVLRRYSTIHRDAAGVYRWPDHYREIS